MSKHSHNHIANTEGNLGKVFYWAIILNVVYTAIEAGAGWITGSVGLLSDAGHNLTDVASLFLALLAFKATKHRATPNYTYGYKRATVEASFINAVILYVVVIFIAVESIHRLISPEPVNGGTIAWVAAAGVAVNGITTWMLLRYSHNDLNVKGAFMHLMADTLVSAGVVISGIIISFTDCYIIDPIIGLIIAVVIAVSSYSLLKGSVRMVLDGVPSNIDTKQVEQIILSIPEIASFHHLHIWPLSTTETAMTVHVVVHDPAKIDIAIKHLRNAVPEAGISHVTVEAETSANTCDNSNIQE